jgi:hypothetical protein
MFEMARFLGEWHVTGSTFPMWLSGRRTSPRFRYGALPGSATGTRMSDDVVFLSNGKERHIRGTDTRLDRPGIVFRWRGKGLLLPLTSQWEVTELDPGYQSAVITFSKSLFTPAGVDYLSRDAEAPIPAEVASRYPRMKDLRS